MPQNVPIAAGLPNITVTGFFSVGDAQQPFVSRLNEVSQFTDDMTWVTRPALDEVRRSTSAGSTWSSTS